MRPVHRSWGVGNQHLGGLQEPEERCVTTLEAVAAALAALERDPAVAAALLAPLRLMTALQVCWPRPLKVIYRVLQTSGSPSSDLRLTSHTE